MNEIRLQNTTILQHGTIYIMLTCTNKNTLHIKATKWLMGKISMNYWSDSNGFFDDNTINTPLYHLMTMFCKIMQRECFFFPSEKPVHGFVIPSVVNATAFDITQPLVLLVSIDCINPQGWSLLSLIPSLIYCHLLVLKQKWQRMNLMY